MRPLFSTCTALVLAIAVSSSRATAQQDSGRGTEAIKVARGLRQGTDLGKAILPLFHAPTSAHSASAIAAIADSMVAYLLSPRRAESEMKMRSVAVSALARAADNDGAADRLRIVAKSAVDPETRVVAIAYFAQVAEHKRAIRILRELALTNDLVSFAAIISLADPRLAEHGGTETLRALSRGGEITDRVAASHLRIALGVLDARKPKN